MLGPLPQHDGLDPPTQRTNNQSTDLSTNQEYLERPNAASVT